MPRSRRSRSASERRGSSGANSTATNQDTISAIVALLTAAGIILVTVAAGLARVLHGPREVDRMMAVQHLGRGGIAALLLAASATKVLGVKSLALELALLSELWVRRFYLRISRTAHG